MQSSPWTEERTERLKRLWADGHSASQVAALLGGISRSSVIGKVHRLGLPKRRTTTRTPVVRQRKLIAHQNALRVASATSAHVRALRSLEAKMRYAETSKAMQDTSEVEPLNVELIDLHEQSCRWPVTAELPHLFCGHTKQEGSSYCPVHHARSRVRAATPLRVLPTRRAA